MGDKEFCAWREDQWDEAWETDCGQYWQFTDGGPADNNVRFCHYCGRPVQVHHAKDDEGGEE